MAKEKDDKDLRTRDFVKEGCLWSNRIDFFYHHLEMLSMPRLLQSSWWFL